MYADICADDANRFADADDEADKPDDDGGGDGDGNDDDKDDGKHIANASDDNAYCSLDDND